MRVAHPSCAVHHEYSGPRSRVERGGHGGLRGDPLQLDMGLGGVDPGALGPCHAQIRALDGPAKQGKDPAVADARFDLRVMDPDVRELGEALALGYLDAGALDVADNAVRQRHLPTLPGIDPKAVRVLDEQGGRPQLALHHRAGLRRADDAHALHVQAPARDLEPEVVPHDRDVVHVRPPAKDGEPASKAHHGGAPAADAQPVVEQEAVVGARRECHDGGNPINLACLLDARGRAVPRAIGNLRVRVRVHKHGPVGPVVVPPGPLAAGIEAQVHARAVGHGEVEVRAL
jgi:hypothetical protein